MPSLSRFTTRLYATILMLQISAVWADVSVGVLYPLSGKGAANGQQQQVSIDMFLEKYGDLGPAGKLNLIRYDTRGDNVEAINLTRKLIESDKVVAIVGPVFSGESEVVFPLAVRGQTMIVTPTSAKPGITAANRPWAFRNALTTDKLNGPLVDSWLKAHPGIRKVVIFYDIKDAVSSADARQVFPEVLKSHGIEVSDTITFQTGDVDYSAQVTRAKALAPDGVVVLASYAEGANLLREARKQGMFQPVVAGIAINDPRFAALGGKAVEGVYTANDYHRESGTPANRAWVSQFQQRYRDPPSNAAALMYDTLFLLRGCIIETNIKGSDTRADRQKVQACWAGIKDREAPLTGATTMTASGDAVRKPTVLVVKDGQFSAVR